MEKNIINDYINGQSVNCIAKKYHYGKEKIRKILLENGIKIKRYKGILTKEEEDKLLELYKENVTVPMIEKILKVSKSKIYKTIHKYGTVKNKNKDITDYTKNKIYVDFTNGFSINSLLKKYELSETTIRRILKEKGVIFKRIAHNKVDANIRENIILEYANGLNICELHEKYGYGTTTIARWVKSSGNMRSLSDAFTLSANKGRKHFNGTNLPWFSTKNNKWFIADSLWEAVRMEQLDSDNDVIEWEKNTERIPYIDKNGDNHYYIPDFKILYINNVVVIEEIKPMAFLNNETNQTKFKTAKEYYSKKNIEYKIITENEIGIENIKNFKPTGILKYTQDIKKERSKKLRNERLKRQRIEKRNAENRDR